MKKCVVIYNPNSGKGINEKTLFKIEKILNEFGYVGEIYKSEYKGHTTNIVENLTQTDLVISIGGDGTFNETMTGNFKRKRKLLIAHIPVGTANDIGAMYGYGKNITRNLRLLLNGTVKNIDICTINDQPFTYSAGFGKFVNISYDTPRELKRKYGYFAYLIEALKDFNGPTKLYDITYKIDDKIINGKYSFMLISNANRIAGIENFYKDIKLDDNTFEVLMCDSTARKDIAKGLYFLKTSDITKAPGFSFYKTNKLTITINSDKEIPWSLDGEKFTSETNTYEIKIVRNVKVLLPLKNIKKLFIDTDV
ncbi:MAG: YegS/Rv2252/BmrU family lipid kinase [Lactobacillales bacterium]|nr:YegS/Rv2252/BmrU family lipid kinase [Lactobacillales bacterium]